MFDDDTFGGMSKDEFYLMNEVMEEEEDNMNRDNSNMKSRRAYAGGCCITTLILLVFVMSISVLIIPIFANVNLKDSYDSVKQYIENEGYTPQVPIENGLSYKDSKGNIYFYYFNDNKCIVTASLIVSDNENSLKFIEENKNNETRKLFTHYDKDGVDCYVHTHNTFTSIDGRAYGRQTYDNINYYSFLVDFDMSYVEFAGAIGKVKELLTK